jgi:DNA-binding SARP family transcriptional activator
MLVGNFEYRVLGPVEVRRGGTTVPIDAARQRALLAALLLEPNRVVSVDRLASQIWGDLPPPRARNTVQSLVLRLRRAITPTSTGKNGGVLITRPPGYLLTVEPGQLDLRNFDDLFDRGRRQRESGQVHEAASTLRQALALWRGEPLADAGGVRLIEVDAAHLRERRLQAIEERVEADLALNRNGDLIAELPMTIAENPLRERLYGMLMLALYREGRQAEALDVFQLLRRRLIHDLAVEPGQPIQLLHQQILAQEPSLNLRAARSERHLRTTTAWQDALAGPGRAASTATARRVPASVLADWPARQDTVRPSRRSPG